MGVMLRQADQRGRRPLGLPRLLESVGQALKGPGGKGGLQSPRRVFQNGLETSLRGFELSAFQSGLPRG